MKVDQATEQAQESINQHRLAKRQNEVSKEIRDLNREHINRKQEILAKQGEEIQSLENAYEVKIRTLTNQGEELLQKLQDDYNAQKLQARIRHEEHMLELRKNFDEDMHRFNEGLNDKKTDKYQKIMAYRMADQDRTVVKKSDSNNEKTTQDKKSSET